MTTTDVARVGGHPGTTLGWFYNDDAAIPLTTDLRLFVQLGLEGINNSGALLEQALARLVLDVRPVFGKTLATEYQKVFTDGTTTRVFHPLFDPVPLEDVGEHRATVQLDAPSGSIDVIPAYQLSDDGIIGYDGAGGGAGTFTTFGTAVTTETTTYGTSFSTESIPTGSRRRRFRYGIGAKNGSAGVAEIGLVSMRVDYPEDHLMPVFSDVDAEAPSRAARQHGVFDAGPILVGLDGGTNDALNCDHLRPPSPSFCCNACSRVAPGKGVFLTFDVDDGCKPICDCGIECEPVRPDDKTIIGPGLGLF